MTTDEPDYDVVVVGGALSGSSVAILLKREHPEMKVLIVEKSEVLIARWGRRQQK